MSSDFTVYSRLDDSKLLEGYNSFKATLDRT